MIENFCRVKHDPPNSYGDCLRACIASLLNMNDPEQVPHFHHDGCDGEEALRRMNAYLSEKHYMKAFFYGFSGDVTMHQIMNVIGHNNPGVHYLLQGSNGQAGHVVICCNDKVVHDPSWGVGGLTGPLPTGQWLVTILIPLILVSHK